MAEEIKKSVEKREITAELQESYLDYAMSVIVSRALPDIRDGLKPVQRRILWNMWESGLTHSAKFRKSANVVGEVLGRYHPHSDTAVYDTMVRMAQDFSLRYPLIDGQGNFGSVDGDSAAAYRYTEARLSRIAEEMLEDIQKETVDWMPNYDGQRQEPKVLPGRLPNLLLNGTVGIAVGMATNIPPHNLNEIAEAILYLSENLDATNEDLLKFVKGPDFPTGGVIFDEKAIKLAYSSGKGSIVARAKAAIEERKNKQFDIIITEIPYQVNKSELIKTIAELAEAKKIEGIRDIRDESDREGLRIVIELKNDAAPQKVLNQLYKHTTLQKDFHLNMLALVDGLNPRILSLREILAAYLEYRKTVIRRRTEFDLKEAKARAHILEGLVKALDVIDKIIATIKKSKDKEEAHANLMKGFKLSALQTTAILEMRLQTLAALEREKIEAELKEKKVLILELEAILKSPAKLLKIIKDEIKELQQKYGDDRKTEVVRTGVSEFKEEDLVPQEEAIISLSANGYIKRLPPDTFHTQRRGGKGLIGSEVGEEDFITHFTRVNTHDNLLFFTNRGRVFQTKAYEIPVASRVSKGKAIHNFLELPVEENITALVSYAESHKSNADQRGKSQRESASSPRESAFLVMATKNGVIKKTALSDFENIRRTGIIAISLQKDDSLNWVRLSGGSDQMIVTTKKAQSIRFKESQVRPMGRSAAGTRAIKLKKDDSVAGFDIINTQTNADQTQTDAEKNHRESASSPQKSARLLVVMENGFAKQTPLKEYKLQNRGGSGIKTANITAKTGSLVSASVVSDQTEIFALSSKGQMIRTQLESVRMTGRAAQGVKIMNLGPGDKLAGIVVI